MEQKKIYRGNFINFMTGKFEPTLARSSSYTLNIVEGEKSFFYHVLDVDSPLFSMHQIKEERLTTCVLTDWNFLQNKIQARHLLTLYPHDSIQTKTTVSKDFRQLENWASQFDSELPHSLILKLYYELDYLFEKIEHRKKYDIFLTGIHSHKQTYQIDEFLIDNNWYLNLGRESYQDGKLSESFQYNLKYAHIVREEKNEFRKKCAILKKEFPISSNHLLTALLQLSNNDINLCRSILLDVVRTRENILSSRLTSHDRIYVNYLKSKDFTLKTKGMRYFIKDWQKIVKQFQLYNKTVKNELFNFMLGR